MNFEAVAAFLSGAGAVLGGIHVLRSTHRQAKKDCDDRVSELRAEFDRGMERLIRLEEHREASG